jgi:dTDP-4-dehydrorhamnose 3,5-epimerase-like enzyme
MNVTRLPRQKHVRDDGWLAELISMKYTDDPFCGIHSYIVSICPGRSRANHFHRKKKNGSLLWQAPPGFCWKIW